MQGMGWHYGRFDACGEAGTVNVVRGWAAVGRMEEEYRRGRGEIKLAEL